MPAGLPAGQGGFDLEARPRLDLDTPLDFVTTNDLIGGNSGSPVVDREGRVVGLVFDGNIHSLGGDYGYDPVDNRAVAVHASALLEALDRIYGVQRLAAELTSSAGPASGGSAGPAVPAAPSVPAAPAAPGVPAAPAAR